MPAILLSQNCIKSHDDVIKWKHFPRYWSDVRGIHRSPVNPPHNGQWRKALMFSLICVLNNRLSKKSWGWWLETPSRSLWRHCNANWIQNIVLRAGIRDNLLLCFNNFISRAFHKFIKCISLIKGWLVCTEVGDWDIDFLWLRDTRHNIGRGLNSCNIILVWYSIYV